MYTNSLCELRTVRAHGMVMQHFGLLSVYRSVALAKPTKASNRCFTNGVRSTHIIIRQSKRGRFVPLNLLPLADLCRASDTGKKLFSSVIINNDKYMMNFCLRYQLPSKL